MIARHWRGWTGARRADTYEAYLKEHVLPKMKNIEGYLGGYVFRRNEGSGVEFVVINLFDSLDAVKRFAGQDYSVAVVEPEAKALLSEAEPRAIHYEVRASTI